MRASPKAAIIPQRPSIQDHEGSGKGPLAQEKVGLFGVQVELMPGAGFRAQGSSFPEARKPSPAFCELMEGYWVEGLVIPRKPNNYPLIEEPSLLKFTVYS